MVEIKLNTMSEEERLKIEQKQQEEKLNAYIPSRSQSIINFMKKTLAENSTQDTETILMVAGIYPLWKAGKHKKGDYANAKGNTWECTQDHDNDIYPDINPDNFQTWANFWKPLHGKSKETARPFCKPVAGITDMYLSEEYMIFKEKIYRCLSNTVFSPEEYPQAWSVVE